MSKTPLLPAPTDSWIGEHSELAPTDLATDISRRTDRTSYSIPEDGRPVTLPTKHLQPDKEGISQASLLIEYFEISGGQSGRPSVRVKVTPSNKKDQTLPTHRKPSYTQRVSLTTSQQNVRSVTQQHERNQDTSIGIQDPSDISANSTFRHNHIHLASDISSMPADSMIEAPSSFKEPERSSTFDPKTIDTGHTEQADVDLLKAPSRRRSRSLSKERITQKVLEKLAREQSPEEEHKAHRTRRRRPTSSSIDIAAEDSKPRSRKSSRSYRDDEHGSLTESSLLHTRDRESSVSGLSKSSLNPRLLRTVEDVVRRLILPEIETIKRQQSVRESRPHRDSSGTENSYPRGDGDRQLSQSISIPHLKPKVVLKRDGDSPARSLASDHLQYRNRRRPSKDSFVSRGHTHTESVDSLAEEKDRHRRDKDVEVTGVLGGALTAAALKSHDSRSTTDSPERNRRERRKKRSKSHARSVPVKQASDELETRHEARRMPMDSEVVDSEFTRESILSAETIETDNTVPSERDESSVRVQEVSRGASREASDQALHNSSHRPRRTERDQPSPQRTRSRSNLSTTRSDHSLSSKARKAALLAAGFGAGSSALYGHDKDYSIEQKSSLRSREYEPKPEQGRSNRNVATPDAPDALIAKQHSARDYSSKASRLNVTDSPPRSITQSDEAPTSFLQEVNFDRHALTTTQATKQSDAGQELRGVSADAALVSTPQLVESHVASLLDPSNLSSQSGKSTRNYRSTGETFEDQTDHNTLTGLHESTSAERWAALRGHAHQRSVDVMGGKEVHNTFLTITPERQDSEQPAHTKNANALADHQLMESLEREAEHSTEKTDRSILEGPLGDEHENRGQWPYEPTPPSQRMRSAYSSNDYLDDPYMAAALADATAGLGIGGATVTTDMSSLEGRQEQDQSLSMSRPGVSRDRYPQEEDSIPHSKDRALTGTSPLVFSKTPPRLFDEEDHGQYKRVGQQVYTGETRQLGSDSHATKSPLYDSATGQGINNIQSKDVVALMDHLTVRDGHRNARDTEILVTLVRSAAEMRNSFEDMKKFVESQNQINMQRGDAATDRSVSKILNAANRSPQYLLPQAFRSSTATDESPGKKRNLFQRALKGLSSRNTSDLSRMEDMLMQLLDEVESLKAIQGANAATARGEEDLGSLEKLRSKPSPNYKVGSEAISAIPAASGDQDISNRVNTTATTNQTTIKKPKITMAHNPDEDGTYDDYLNYSGEDGLRTPTNQVSPQQNMDENFTIDDLTQSAAHFDTSPTRKDSVARHRSGGSSLFGIPRISRWSKTTASSVPITPNRRSQRDSEQSRFEFDTPGELEEAAYSPADADRLTRSLGGEDEQLGRRSASPLLPDSELSLEEAKYRANRHSLTLQHPQPRQGPNQNQRSLMETQARAYGGVSPDAQLMSPTSDAFGSAPSLGRFGRFGASQDYRPSTLSPSSSSGLSIEQAKIGDHPLMAERHAGSVPYAPVQYNQEEAYSSDAHSEDFDDGDGQWIEPVPLPRKQSPYSPGGLLAPIEERYSLEHTRSSISATPAQDRLSLPGDRSETPLQAPRPAIGGSESPTARKITGPRDMPTRSRMTSRT